MPARNFSQKPWQRRILMRCFLNLKIAFDSVDIFQLASLVFLAGGIFNAIP